MKYKSFETERLIIRPTTESDSEFIFKLLNTPKWLKYIGDRNIKTVENAKEYIKDKNDVHNLKDLAIQITL